MTNETPLWQILDREETRLLGLELINNYTFDDENFEKARIEAVQKWIESRCLEEFEAMLPDVGWVCSELQKQAQICNEGSTK